MTESCLKALSMGVQFHCQLLNQDIWNLDVNILTFILEGTVYRMMTCPFLLAKGREGRNKNGRVCCVTLDFLKQFNTPSSILDNWPLRH